ncbi:calcium-binding protein, partial [Roseomonas populi]|uniref:calcium-binding protein n=1 Tax=Roseomonas populi TaxID=3121582 RepID=UPI0027E314D6
LQGGNGHDWLSGGVGNDQLEGGAGNDTLQGDAGDDALIGGAGDDVFGDYQGANTADGGDGADTFQYVSYGSGKDTLKGGTGQDVFELYWQLGQNFVADLVSDFQAGAGGDLINLNQVLGSLQGYQSGSNPFTTGYLRLVEQDTNGDGVADVTLLQVDGDGPTGSRKEWRLNAAGTEYQEVTVSEGWTTLLQLNGVRKANLTVANFEPSFSPTGAGVKLVGTAGDDNLSGTLSNDTLQGGNGHDWLSGGVGNDQLEGGAGNDTLQGDAGDDALIGGAGDDVFGDYQGANTADGGDGADTFQYVSYGSGKDTLKGGTGQDVFELYWQLGQNFVADLVSDFQAGAGGDLINLNQVLGSLQGYQSGSNPFTTGYLRLVEQDTNGDGVADVTLLQVDGDGPTGSRKEWRLNAAGTEYQEVTVSEGWTTLLQLNGVRKANLTVANFEPSFSPTGVGQSSTATSGNDYLVGGSSDDVLTGLAGQDTLDGGDGDDTLSGDEGADMLRGGAGDDTLIGGTGNDTLDGGDGSDWLDLSAATGVAVVNLGKTAVQTLVTDQGRDVVLNVENVLGGAFADNFTGTAGANTLIGGGGNDRLFGLDGADTLQGDAGNDTLDGGLGADWLAGGAADDTYLVDNLGDTVTETTAGLDAGGLDLVKASVSFTLGAYVENLTLTGTAALTGMGNGLNNVLTGNDGANLIQGLDGNDTLMGGRGADTLLGGSGNDTFVGLDAGDWLDGGEGTDTLSMAKVNSRSWIYLDGTDEKGVAQANAYAATGTVLLSVENITGSASGSDAYWGTSGANTLSGLGGSDRLYGKGGNDRLEGGDGNDTLSGGAGSDDLIGGTGADQFVFDVAPNASAVDRIIDFEAGMDKVVISRGAFGIASGATPALIANAAPVASGPGGVLLYDTAGGGAGGLFWDADGAGGTAAVQIARLSNAAPISASDFLFVA